MTTTIINLNSSSTTIHSGSGPSLSDTSVRNLHRRWALESRETFGESSTTENSFSGLLPTSQVSLASQSRNNPGNWNRVRKVLRMNHTLFNIRNQMQIEGNYLSKEQSLTKKQKLKRFFIHLCKKLSVCWAIIRPFIMIYSVLLIPYRCANSIYSLAWTIIDLIFDCLLLGDNLINFIHRRKLRLQNPLILEHPTLLKDTNTYKYLVSSVVNLPIQLAMRELIVLKTLRLWEVRSFFNRISAFAQKPRRNRLHYYLHAFSNIINTGITLLIVLHIAACYWIWLASLDSLYGNWLSTWSIDIDRSPSLVDIYIQSLLYMFEVVSAAGYGEIHPNSNTEMFFVMMMEFMKHLLYVQVIYNLRTLLGNLYYVENQNRKEQEELLIWFFNRNKGCRRSLYSRKINKDLLVFLREAKRKNINTILKTNRLYWILSFDLRYRVGMYLLEEDMSPFRAFFENLSSEFKLTIFQELMPLKVPAGQHLFVTKKHCDGIYFIMDGLVQEVSSSDHDTIHKVFSRGSILGLRQVLYSRKLNNEYITAVDINAYYVPKEIFLNSAHAQARDFEELKKFSMKEIFGLLFQAPRRLRPQKENPEGRRSAGKLKQPSSSAGAQRMKRRNTFFGFLNTDMLNKSSIRTKRSIFFPSQSKKEEEATVKQSGTENREKPMACKVENEMQQKNDELTEIPLPNGVSFLKKDIEGNNSASEEVSKKETLTFSPSENGSSSKNYLPSNVKFMDMLNEKLHLSLDPSAQNESHLTQEPTTTNDKTNSEMSCFFHLPNYIMEKVDQELKKNQPDESVNFAPFAIITSKEGKTEDKGGLFEIDSSVRRESLQSIEDKKQTKLEEDAMKKSAIEPYEENEEIELEEKEDELNSSFETPIDAVLPGELIESDEIFTVDQISDILQAKLRYSRMLFDSVRNKLNQQILMSQNLLKHTSSVIE